MFPSFLTGHFAINKDGKVNDDILSQFCKHVAVGSLQKDSSEHGHSPLLRPLRYPTIMICSHNSRDSRCGVLGPLLYEQFRNVLSKAYPTKLPLSDDDDQHRLMPDKVNVGMISHVGGHKWAGNVIINLPATWRRSSSSPGDANSVPEHSSPLAGASIWYGRVEPKHVEGIVEETLLEGSVIQELFRGGIGQDGKVFRVP